MLQTLHLVFETQSNELTLAVDLIAERICSLGVPRCRESRDKPTADLLTQRLSARRRLVNGS
jgi:DNA-binding ferritin-like protein